MSNLKQLAGDTAIYGVSSILGKAINFLLVPFYTSTAILSVAEYGIVSELYAYVAVLNVLYVWGMETAFFRFVSRDPERARQVLNTAVSAVFIGSLVFSTLLGLFATPIVEWLEFPGRERFIYWFALIIAIDAVVAIPFALLRYERKSLRFALTKLFNIGLNIGLNIFFLYFCKQVYQGAFLPALQPLVAAVYNPAFNVEYVFISNLIANATYLLLLWPEFRRIRFGIHRDLLRPMFRYAWPLLFSQLAGVTNEMFSRMILKKMLPEGFYPGLSSQEALSIFAACYKLSIFMTLAIQAFRFAAEPFFFAQSQTADARHTYRKVYRYYVLFGLLAFVAISLNLDWIKVIFLRDPAYWQGLHIVPFLLLGNFFLGVYFNISIWYKITDRTYFGTLITLVTALLTIGLNIALIPYFGYEASAAITLGVYFFESALGYLLGQRYYPVDYELKRPALYLLLAVAMVWTGWQLRHPWPLLQQALRELPVLAFLAVVLLSERKNLRRNGINA